MKGPLGALTAMLLAVSAAATSPNPPVPEPEVFALADQLGNAITNGTSENFLELLAPNVNYYERGFEVGSGKGALSRSLVERWMFLPTYGRLKCAAQVEQRYVGLNEIVFALRTPHLETTGCKYPASANEIIAVNVHNNVVFHVHFWQIG